jgi:hypothetical protein
MHATRIILVAATLVSAVIFLGMTVDSLRQMGVRTEGRWLRT